MSLLYLNNNLHAVHHAEPQVSWYKLPKLYRQAKTTYLAENRHYFIDGYNEIFRKYLFKPKEKVRHPIV